MSLERGRGEKGVTIQRGNRRSRSSDMYSEKSPDFEVFRSEVDGDVGNLPAGDVCKESKTIKTNEEI